jgi:hypothetical protein
VSTASVHRGQKFVKYTSSGCGAHERPQSCGCVVTIILDTRMRTNMQSYETTYIAICGHMYPCPMRDETATKSLYARISNDWIVSSTPACLLGREWSILASRGAQGPCSSPDVISFELCRVDASDCIKSDCMSILAERPQKSPEGVEAALFCYSSTTFFLELDVVVQKDLHVFHRKLFFVFLFFW